MAGSDQAIADGVRRKISLRLIPLLIVIYILAHLDRVNVSFAALTMNQDLGFSNAVYGLGAGPVLLWLLPVRGAGQPAAGAHRRAAPDRQHHADLGHGVGVDGVRRLAHAVLCHAFRAGRGRVGSVPGHHPVPDLLVPQRRPGHGDWPVRAGAGGGRPAGQPAVRRHHGRHGRPAGAGELAVVVHRRRACRRCCSVCGADGRCRTVRRRRAG